MRSLPVGRLAVGNLRRFVLCCWPLPKAFRLTLLGQAGVGIPSTPGQLDMLTTLHRCEVAHTSQVLFCLSALLPQGTWACMSRDLYLKVSRLMVWEWEGQIQSCNVGFKLKIVFTCISGSYIILLHWLISRESGGYKLQTHLLIFFFFHGKDLSWITYALLGMNKWVPVLAWVCLQFICFSRSHFIFKRSFFSRWQTQRKKKVFRLSYQAGDNLIVFMHLLDLLLVGGLNMLPGK